MTQAITTLGIMFFVGVIVFFLLPFIKNYILLGNNYKNYENLTYFVSYDKFHQKMLMTNLRPRILMAFLVVFKPELTFVECVKSPKLLDDCCEIAKYLSESEEESENCQTKSDSP